jgi:hypothetical protein
MQKRKLVPRSYRQNYILHKFDVDVVRGGKIIDQVRRALNIQQSSTRSWLRGSKDLKGNRPLIIKYRKKWWVAHSWDGDLSDPNERNDSFLQSLFIDLGEKY